MGAHALEITFLGGLGEIGANCMAWHGPEGILLVDMGIGFPRGRIPAPDYQLPDLDWLEDRGQDIKALLLTHAHEDHVGAVPWFLMRCNVPVYAPPFALELVRNKLDELGIEGDLRPLHPRQTLRLAGMDLEMIRVTHSIPDALAVALRTPQGIVLHTGDFRIEDAPTDGDPFQMEAFRRFGDEGVVLMMSDSTNAEVPGHTRAEAEVAQNLEAEIAAWSGRVLLTMFASNVNRMGQIETIARRTGRRVCLMGRSLHSYLEVAERAHIAPFRDESTVDPSRVGSLRDDQVLIIMTGSQGEPRSALARLADGTHPHLSVREGDLVLFSSKVIPGNELEITRMTNGLCRLGAKVVWSTAKPIHASGHAQRDELAAVLEAARPRWFVPVHGEYRFLKAHAELAEERTGARTLVVETGDVIRLKDGEVQRAGHEPVRPLFVDGPLVGDEDELDLRERRRLLYNGVVFLDIPLNAPGETVVHMPGVPDLYKDLKEQIVTLVVDALTPLPHREERDAARTALEASVRRLIRRETEKRPVVTAILR
ncbi:MAG: ribonuclease J [Pseudomonadota bacterium]